MGGGGGGSELRVQDISPKKSTFLTTYLFKLTVKEKGDGVPGFYAYIRFYSARCTSRARAAVLRQDVRLHGCQPFKVLDYSLLEGGSPPECPATRLSSP